MVAMDLVFIAVSLLLFDSFHRDYYLARFTTITCAVLKNSLIFLYACVCGPMGWYACVYSRDGPVSGLCSD